MYKSIRTYILIAFLGLFAFNLAGQTTYTSAPASGTFTSTTNTDKACSSGGYTSYGQNALKMKVTITGNQAKFRIQKAGTGNFSASGTAYIKESDACGNVLGQATYSTSVNYVEITILLTHTSGTEDYCGMIKQTASPNWRNHTPTISITANTLSCGMPDPASFGATNTTCNSFKANWFAVSGATGYQVNVAEQGASFPNSGFLSTTTTNKTITGLNPCKDYKFQVRANCSGNYSTWSPSLQNIELPDPTLTVTAPSNGSTINIGASVNINWTASSTACLNNYVLQWVPNSTGVPENIVVSLTSSATSYSWTPTTLFTMGPGKIKIYDQVNNCINNLAQTYSVTLANPGNGLVLGSAIVCTPNPLVQGQAKQVTYSVRNNGSSTFHGTIKLIFCNSSGVSIAVMHETFNESLTVGQTKNYTHTYPTTTASPGSYKIRVEYSTNTNWLGYTGGSPVGTGGFTNPIDINVVLATGNCSFTDCPTSTNCGGTSYQSTTYDAVQYLCSHFIINSSNNNVRPNDLITRAELAKITLYGVFGDSLNIPDPLVSDYFPSPYADLQNTNTFYYRAAKALLYLQYDDGITPFDRNRFWFEPNGNIERCLVLKVMLEAFNILPATSGSNPFTDFPSSAAFYGYAKKAFALGITNTTTFRPHENCTRAEAFIFLHRIITMVGLPTVNNTLDLSTSSFFIPSNRNLASMTGNMGMESGNFNHYTKTCFAIPGRNVSLDFGFTYNSYLTEMPSELYPLEPLGNAWSHTYNMYLNFIYGPTVWDTKFAVHMPDGSLLIYTFDSLTYAQNGTIAFLPETKGNYNILTNISSTKYELKTKSQVVYTFQKLGSSDVAFVLTSIKDRNNNTITISYIQGEPYTAPGTSTAKNTRKISSVSDPAGRTLQFSYVSGTNLISSVTDPLSRNIHFSYSGGRLATFTDAKGQNTSYTYGTSITETGLLKTIQLPKGNVITNTYLQRKLTSTKYNNNSPTTIEHNPNYVAGNNDFYKSTVSVPQQGGQNITTNYEMNGQGNITKADGNDAVDLSSSFSNSSHPTLPSNIINNKTNVTVSPQYDSRGNVTQITVSGNGINTTESFQYNTINDVTQHTDANGHTTTYYYTNGNLSKVTDALGNETTFSNNSYGQPTSVVNPSNVTVNLGYNSYGNQSSVSIPSLGLSASMNYDAASRMTSATNFSGQTSTYIYNNNDKLVSEKDALNNTTTYSYDPNDNLLGITNAKGYSTSFTYDYDKDFLLSESFQGATKSYTYNEDGTLNTFTNPNGNILNYTYDNAGRKINDGYASYAYLSNGNLASVTKSGKAITFGYDGLNRVNSIAYDGNTVGYTYDDVGNLLTMTYPGNKTVTYTYDAVNQLKTVKDWNNNTTNYYYRPDGQIDYMVYPNSVKTTYTYDNAGRPTAMSTKRNNGSGTEIAGYTFALDPLDNHTLESIIEPYATYQAVATQTINYSYNNANRIQNAGSINFGFDNNGNTTSKTGYTYAYDVLNNLTNVSGNFNASYVYDGAGNRREATRGGAVTKYVLDILGMSNVLMETDGSGTPQNYYVYGLGLISRIKPDNTTHYYVYDYRGSTVAMVDATPSANVTHKYQYDDFGKVLQAQEADYNPCRYVGRYGVMYEDSTLQFMRARYYDPTIGRFLSEDPIWSANLYPYTKNNPVITIDPSGKINKILELSLSFGYDYLENNAKGNTYGIKEVSAFVGSTVLEESSKKILGAAISKFVPVNTIISALSDGISTDLIESATKDVASVILPVAGSYVVSWGVQKVQKAYDDVESKYLYNKNYIKENHLSKDFMKKLKNKKYSAARDVLVKELKNVY